jgi:hypothetical protein
MKTRGLCPTCNQRPVAINYHRGEVTYYRKVCDVCNRLGRKIKPLNPSWAKSGYKKKPHCEKCGFKAKLPTQLGVFYVDANLKNSDWSNLKTVCLNCQQEIYKLNLGWRQDSIRPDF